MLGVRYAYRMRLSSHSSEPDAPDSAQASWRVRDLMALMESWYPQATAQSWDRVGLIVGDPDAPVRSLLLALDPTAAIAEQAVAGPDSDGHPYDMVITHHPLLLRGASFLPVTDPKGAVVTRLIRAGVSLFNAHTNADVACEGVATALADLIGLRDTVPLEPCGVDADGHEIGLGRVGTIEPTTLGAFADHVASVLPAGPTGLLVGGDEAMAVSRVAVLGGAGDSALDAARAADVDVYLTADLRHHPASEHLEGGRPALLCGSHWATESPWLPVLARRIRAAASASEVELRVEVSTIVTEPWTSYRVTQGGLA